MPSHASRHALAVAAAALALLTCQGREAQAAQDRLELMPETIRKPLDLPKTAKELVQRLNQVSATLQTLVTDGALPQVSAHVMDAKDIALGFDDHLNEAPAASRLKVSVAIRNAVASSWAMEGFAHLGDRQQVLDAHRVYTAAVADLKDAYAKAR